MQGLQHPCPFGLGIDRAQKKRCAGAVVHHPGLDRPQQGAHSMFHTLDAMCRQHEMIHQNGVFTPKEKLTLIGVFGRPYTDLGLLGWLLY